MPTNSRLSDDDARWFVDLIQTKVRRFLGPSLRNEPPDLDLVHDVLLNVLERLPRYDASRASLATFVARVAETTLIDLARRTDAQKRNPRQADTANSARSSPASLNDTPDPNIRSCDLEMDLIEAIQRLSPELRRTAQQLRNSSVPEIAEREGVHRGTIYRRVKDIRRIWDDGTLRDYLDP